MATNTPIESNEPNERRDRDYFHRVIKAFQQQGYRVLVDPIGGWITVFQTVATEDKGGLTANIKAYRNPSRYGVNQGRISKLEIRHDGKQCYHYDRGLDFDHLNRCPGAKALLDSILVIAN